MSSWQLTPRDDSKSSCWVSWFIKNKTKLKHREKSSHRAGKCRGRIIVCPKGSPHQSLLVWLGSWTPMFNRYWSSISLLCPLHGYHSSLGLVLLTISAARLKHPSLVLNIQEQTGHIYQEDSKPPLLSPFPDSFPSILLSSRFPVVWIASPLGSLP